MERGEDLGRYVLVDSLLMEQEGECSRRALPLAFVKALVGDVTESTRVEALEGRIVEGTLRLASRRYTSAHGSTRLHTGHWISYSSEQSVLYASARRSSERRRCNQSGNDAPFSPCSSLLAQWYAIR